MSTTVYQVYCRTAVTGILLCCGDVNFGAVLPLSVLSYLNERWKDKSTCSTLAAGCPLRLRLYLPAFAADLSSTMRLRSISSLPMGSIPSIRSASAVAARLRVHAVPIGLGADSKLRRERGWVTCGPQLLLCVVDCSLSEAHPSNFVSTIQSDELITG